MDRTVLVVLALAITGCGARVADSGAGDAGNTAPATTGRDCAADARALAPQVAGQECFTIVRVSFVDHAVLGWQIACGQRTPIDQAAAKQAFLDAAAAIKGPASPPFPPASDSYPPDPSASMTGDYVFRASPLDFGGLAIVSRNMTTPMVVWGTTVWTGRGELELPSSWLEPPRGGCRSGALPDARLVQGNFQDGAPPLTALDRDAAIDAVWATPIPAALSQSMAIHDSMVVGYPRTVGMLDPRTAELLVVLDSTLLE